MKPNIYMHSGLWFCEPHNNSFSYVVGNGDSPMAAYTSYMAKLHHS